MKTSLIAFLKHPSVSRLLNFLVLSFLFFRESLPEGFATKIGGSTLTVTANADSIVKNLGSSDAASLLALGQSWAQNVGIVESGMEWVVRLWTPGLPYLESILLRIFGLNAPIYLCVLFLTFILWISCFDHLFRFTQRIFGLFWALIVNIFLITSPDVRFLISNPLNSEAISTGLFVLSLLFIFQFRLSNYSYRNAVIAGCLFGLSIMFRHGFDSLLISMSVILFGYTIVKVLTRVRINTGNRDFLSQLRQSFDDFESSLKTSIFFILTAWLITLPLRLLYRFSLDMQGFQLSASSSLLGQNIWFTQDSFMGTFWNRTGMNWACRIDESKCVELNVTEYRFPAEGRLLFEGIVSAIKNPFDFVSVRTESLLQNWSFTETPSFFENLYLVGIFPVLLISIYLFRSNLSKLPLGVVILLTGSTLALLAQLLILHYETRYFIPIRLCFFLLTIYIFSELSRQPIRLSQKRSGAKVHPSAICETLSVGRGTRIWSNVHILPGAKIGEDCNICEFVFIENNVFIGNRTTIKSGVQVWDQIVIGNDVFIGPNATFTNDKYPVSKGSFDQNLITRIENGVSIGAGAIILPGITIGENSLIGAGALVTKDVPSGSICVGVPGVSRKRSTESTPIEKP